MIIKGFLIVTPEIMPIFGVVKYLVFSWVVIFAFSMYNVAKEQLRGKF